MVGIDGIGVFAIVLTVQLCQQLCRCRHRLAGDAILILELLDEFEMLHKRVIFAADLAADTEGTVGGLFAMEVIAMIQLYLVDAMEAPHEIQMPVAAAELAVCDGVEAGALLLFDQPGDLFVFHSGQCGAVDRTGLVLCAGLLQCVGTQEAAHKVVTERRLQF